MKISNCEIAKFRIFRPSYNGLIALEAAAGPFLAARHYLSQPTKTPLILSSSKDARLDAQVLKKLC